MPQVHVSSSYFRDIFGEPDVKRGGKRISSVMIASARGTQGGEIMKGIASVVDIMLKARDQEASINEASYKKATGQSLYEFKQ